jgi:hypothetical protein
VSVTVELADAVIVGLGVWVGVNVPVAVGLAVCVGLTVDVADAVGVNVWVGVGVFVARSATAVSFSVGQGATVGVCGASIFRPQPASASHTMVTHIQYASLVFMHVIVMVFSQT